MGIDVKTLSVAKSKSKKYTDTSISNMHVGIQSVSSVGNQLSFLMKDNSTLSVTLNGLSDNNFTNNEKDKLDLLNDNLLNMFSVDSNGKLLFNGNPVENTVDLSDYYTKEEVDALFNLKKGSIVVDWLSGGNFSQYQLISYQGKLYKTLNVITNATTSPDIDAVNYEAFTSGGSVSGNVKIPGFTANYDYSYTDLIIYNKTLMMAKKSFTSAALFNQNDWIIISDMLKSTYDTNNNGKVDYAEYADQAFSSLQTSILQIWQQNTSYTAGQNVIYNNEMYVVASDFVSGTTFDKTNLVLLATGTHNRMTNLQGGDSISQYFHVTQAMYILLTKMADASGKLSYNGKTYGDMDKSVYDTNNDGIVDKATTLNGLSSSITELNYLQGATSNIQAQINAMSSVGNFSGSVPTHADIATNYPVPKNKDMVIVIADETHGGGSTIYLYNGTSWNYTGGFTATIRDFSTNPINVVTESTGMYEESRIDPLIARKTDIPAVTAISNLSLLATYTQTDADLANAVVNSHTHLNKTLLDSYTQTNTDLADSVSKKHTHTNQSVLDKFTEDTSGNPLYNGHSIVGTSSGGSSGGGGITDLSTFRTSDLVDTTNYRYVTDSEKANIQNLTAIVAAQTAISNTLTNINSSIPSDSSSSNKLVSTTTMNTAINNVKLMTLSDVDHTVKPSSFLVTNATGTQVIYLPSIKSMIKIQQINDMNGGTFYDVPELIFNDLKGVQDASGNVTLSLKNLFTTNLSDMPATYDDGKVLVANNSLMKYELKNIGDLTNSKSNYTRTIGQTDWIQDTTTGKYTFTVDHELNSINLIVGFLDSNGMNIAPGSITWGIFNGNDPTKILVQANTNASIRVVVNCSQGAVGSGTGTGGSATVTMTDFLDDTRIRTDKTYSSSQIMTVLNAYAQKSTVYTKTESTSLFAAKINEHIHSNLSLLNKISEDTNGNMYYGGKKILTQLEPITYQNKWTSQVYASSTLLVDTNVLFNTNNYNAILNTELTLKNEVASVDTTTDAKLENQVHLVVLDGTLTILDVYIPPQSTQKYILGISPNIKIMVNGTFSANYYLTAY